MPPSAPSDRATGDAPPAVVNMVDVASRAGVSIATVSRALRDVPGVSATTRDRIRKVADELSYVVSPEASRLSARRTGRVAIVVPRVDLWFYSAMLAGLERALHEADLDVLIYQVDGVEARGRFFRELPARRKVDAVVLVALPVLAEEEKRLDLFGVEVVVAGGQIGGYPHVRVDDHRVAQLAVEHLVALGHRRFAMVRTDDTVGTSWSPDQERTRGFRQALARNGLTLPPDHLLTVPSGVEAGVHGAAELLALTTLPTAVFVYSDEMAIGLIGRLREHGVRVPEDVSVVGVDDHPMSESMRLTTVTQFVEDQARLAGQTVLQLLDPGPDADRRAETALVVEPRLLERGTTAPPRDTPDPG